MENNRYIVLMAGGRGERFWPRSRQARPKHVLSIVGEKPMLAQTLSRLNGIVPKENIFIITNKEQIAGVQSICPELSKDQIIAEPIGRDTAAAVGLANILVKRKNPDATFAILPADHVVHNEEGFKTCLNAAFDVANTKEALVTIGIEPTSPSTAYGYIKKGPQEGISYKVEQFVEKPNLETAKQYLASGNYFWNAGMFVWKTAVLQKALEQHCPELSKGLNILADQLQSGTSLDVALEELYPQLPKISVDYALMEKADNVYTVPSSFDWDDVGEWPAIARHNKPDAQGNIIQGTVISEASSGNIVVSEEGHLVALVGVEDLIVVQTPEATLICHKDKAQDLKKLVNKIKEAPEHNHLL